jgi:light-regulated signal transduction histidine kinase (bacteriophytochrome)
VEVRDNGLDLNEQQPSKLFQMYQRLHVHVEGTGMWLCMVKRMIDNAGGSISAGSEAGVGSTFTVALPDR